MTSTFRVWAPNASTVDLVDARGRRTRMEPIDAGTSKGWFETTAVVRVPGLDYGFSLDGGPLRADPRSAWQPEGPEGPSRVVEHGSFTWSDRSWRGFHLPSAVLYELHVGTFSPEGTFDGAIGRLDHLADLGISAIEVMPVAEFPGTRGWGYDGVNLFAPHHSYGGPDGLRRLVDACHSRGIAVILDVVYNHLGPSGNYLGEFGPYFTDRYRTPWGQAVNFDGPGSDEVRRFVIDNAIQWLRDYHCDGLRMDAVHALFDTSELHILEELSREVAELSAATGWRRWLIAEFDRNDPRLVRSRDAGGLGVDAQWLDDFHHSLYGLLSGERDGYYRDFGSLGDLSAALTQAYVYQGRYSMARGCRHGRTFDGLSGSSFVGYSQNHDQIGNRARGDRSAANLSGGRLAAAAALTFVAPFVPMLFQGEEWGASTPFAYFTDHTDQDLAEAVRDGRRREFEAFGWEPDQIPDPEELATFEMSRLDWSEVGLASHRDLLDWYRELVAIRRSRPELLDGRLDKVRVEKAGEQVFTVSRGAITVAVNFGNGEAAVPMPGNRVPDSRYAVLVSSNPAARISGDYLALPGDAVSVLCAETAPPQHYFNPPPSGSGRLAGSEDPT